MAELNETQLQGDFLSEVFGDDKVYFEDGHEAGEKLVASYLASKA